MASRNRVKISDSSVVIQPTRRMDPRKTKKCLNLLKTSSIKSVPQRRAPIVQTELSACRACITGVRNETLREARPLRRKASERSIQAPVSVNATSNRIRKTSPAAASQYFPVDCS
jgi:hypothetical protein